MLLKRPGAARYIDDFDSKRQFFSLVKNTAGGKVGMPKKVCGVFLRAGWVPNPDLVRIWQLSALCSPYGAPVMTIVRSWEKVAQPIGEYASPACSMHEVNPSYMGYLTEGETLAFLSDLLRRERLATRIFTRSGTRTRDTGLSKLVLDAELLQRTLCDLLQREISTRADSGQLKSRSATQPSPQRRAARQRVLVGRCYQQELIRIIEAALPKISDASLCSVLKALLEGHAAIVGRIQSALSSIDSASSLSPR